MARNRLIANLGDVNPFDHGGYLIFKTGKNDYQGVYWDSPDSDDEPTEVYRFDIPADVFDYHNWAHADEISSFVGTDADELKALGKSKNPIDRAGVMRDIGSYSGFINFDGYPDTMTTRELSRVYGRALSGFYKRSRR